MSEPDSPCIFPATRWTLIKRLRAGTAEEARAALETLCRAYWEPLYCVARYKNLSRHDAQDAVQGFFECLIRRETFATADEAVGKLRQLLLTSFDHYCTQQWHKANRQKRGAGVQHLELGEFLNVDSAERNFMRSNNGIASMEALYNREWANAILERSLNALRTDYERRGWLQRYELLLKPLLQKEDAATLEQLAAREGVTAGSLRVTLHRMRGHYRSHIERELATTLDTEDPRLIQAELTELYRAFE